MIFAYALLGVQAYRARAVAVLDKAETIHVPDSIRAELGNVVWQWIRQRGVDPQTAFAVMEDAEGLFSRVISAGDLWKPALELAIAAGHPFYDTLFVAAAERERTKLVTNDAKLKAVFPEVVLSMDEFLCED